MRLLKSEARPLTVTFERVEIDDSHLTTLVAAICFLLFASAVAVVVMLFVTTQRLHDIGRSGGYCGQVFLSLVG